MVAFSFCLLQTHTLPGSCLAQLATLFLEAIKGGKMGNGKSLELFPTVLTALSACETLSYGKGYKKKIFFCILYPYLKKIIILLCGINKLTFPNAYVFMVACHCSCV